jgi:hypothetical protein
MTPALALHAPWPWLHRTHVLIKHAAAVACPLRSEL